MLWNDLSMSERAKVIQLGVSQGLTNLNDIKKGYNNFARGGYTKWKERIKEHKNIDIDNDPTYDYEGFYNSDPDRAWNMMNKDSNAHFVDEYKTALHPSFSNQSIYSGYKNKFNPNGIVGGTWIDDNHYQLSQSQFDNDWDTDATLDYFDWAESSPVHLYAPDGSTMLRGVTVTPQSVALNRSRRANSPNTDFSHAQDMTGTQQFGANWLAGVPLIGTDPHTCLNTVTGFYDPENTVASNPNIVANPEDYGYRKIPQNEAVPGDLIILSNGEGHPKHAVMFDSVAEGEGVHNGYKYAPGDTLVNYSNGGRNADDYRLQGPLSRFSDPEKAGGDFSGTHRYYRYVGKKKAKEQNKVNKFSGGGQTDEKYVPATLAGWLTQVFTGDDNSAAKADITSSTVNTTSDAIPVVGNAAGILLSVGDALYDIGKLVYNPSWENAGDVGTSLLGIIPGVGSVKDVKNIAKATKQTYKNVKTTKSVKAVKKTVQRKANPKSNTRINVLSPDMKVQRSYPLQLTTNPFTKVLGTLGNWGDTAEDTYQGIEHLYIGK